MFPLAVISNAHSPHPPTKIKKKKNALNWFICVRKLMYSEIVPDYIFVRVCGFAKKTK